MFGEIVRARITQHKVFDAFAPGGATKLRVTTLCEPDATFCTRTAYLQIPYGDHKFVLSSAGVRIQIDAASGILADTGHMSDRTMVNGQPEPEVLFRGISIPAFSDAVRLCENLHATIPQVGCIGWDLVVDSTSKVWLLEWNASHNDIKFSEAVA